MRILYENLLTKATLSATNGDPNYPVSNLIDQTLQTLFVSTGTQSDITAEFSSPVHISAFALGFHDIYALSVTLTRSDLSTVTYNYSGNELIFSEEVSNKILYITPESSITKIVFSMQSQNDPLTIGGLWAGRFLQFPYFNRSPSMGYRTTTFATKSRYGVIFSSDGVSLETFKAVFSSVEITDRDAIVAMFSVMGNSYPMWLDRWEDSTEFPVLFVNQTNEISYVKGSQGIVFDTLALEFEECK